MNKAWNALAESYIACYNAIQTLAKNGILDEEEKAVHEHNLLVDIIMTFASEVE